MENNQREQSKLVQGGWKPSLRMGETLDTDFKGELASLCRKNKEPTSLGVQLKTPMIQHWKYTDFYIIHAVIDGRAYMFYETETRS